MNVLDLCCRHSIALGANTNMAGMDVSWSMLRGSCGPDFLGKLSEASKKCTQKDARS